MAKKSNYEVIVENIGTVHTGANKVKAHSIFEDYVQASKNKVGRGADSTVTLMKDGEVSQEWIPASKLKHKTVHVISLKVEAMVFVEHSDGSWEYCGPGSTDHEANYTVGAFEDGEVAAGVADSMVERFPEPVGKDYETTEWYIKAVNS